MTTYNQTTTKLRTFRLPAAVRSIKRESGNRIHMLFHIMPINRVGVGLFVR